MLLLAVCFYVVLLSLRAVLSSPVLSINISILDQTTGARNVSPFEVHPGELVEEAITAFGERNALPPRHLEELFDAVRDASLIQGQALLPVPTLVLPHTSTSPFSPPHADDMPTVILGGARQHHHQAAARDAVHHSHLHEVLKNQSRQSGPPSNCVYALVSSDAQFRPGLTPHEVFLEYDRLRFSHTGQFSGEFVLVLTCGGGSTGPLWDVIMFSSSLLWNVEVPDGVSTDAIVKALLDSPVAYRAPSILSRRLLTCHDVDLPEEEAGTLDALVVVLTQGNDDPTTWGVFRDVANVLHQGLQAVGLASALVICSFLDKCRLPQQGPQWFILASHNLASYLSEDDNQPAVLSRDDLIPPDAVLYNFEHIPLAEAIKDRSPSPPTTPAHRRGSLVCRSVMQIYKKYQMWDYSSANVERLRSHNISATYVPVGFGSSLFISKGHDGPPPPAFADRQIDVLFYGTVLPRRQRIIRELRASGIRVVYASAANNGTFGEELDAYILDSRVILNLGAFDDDTEWKMTRFMKPLANRRLIISERSVAEEHLLFEGGIVFADTASLVSTCLHYLSHPSDAERVASEGYRLYSQMKESDVLRGLPLVQKLMIRQRRG